jgi:two-component system, sensor histidine kinase and response regulator
LFATIARWLPASSPSALNRPVSAGAQENTTADSGGVDRRRDDVLDIAVLEQLKHDLDEIVLPDLVDAFLSEARMRAGRIAEGVANGNLTMVEREAHTLKSSAATFGAAPLAEAVRMMERTCRSGDTAVAERLTGRILALVEESAGAYQALGLTSRPSVETPVAETVSPVA